MILSVIVLMNPCPVPPTALDDAATPTPYDVLIAAQARRAGALLVTANRREFHRVPGLIVTDRIACWA